MSETETTETKNHEVSVDGEEMVTGQADEGENTPLEPPNSLARAKPAALKPWQQRFVDCLRDAPIVAMACKAAGISRVTAYHWRNQDEAFRTEWDSALEDGWDGVEEKALSMAKDGSERMIELLLRGNKAKTYRETHGGPLVNIQLGSTEAIEAAKTSEELKRFALEFAKSGGKLAENGGSS